MKKTNIKKPKFRFILGFVCGALIFGSIGAFANSTFTQITAQLKPELPLYINGEKIELQNGALYYNNTNYLSLREVAEINGYQVDFDPKTQNIDLVGGVEFDVDDEDGDIDKNNDKNNKNNSEKDDENLQEKLTYYKSVEITQKLFETYFDSEGMEKAFLTIDVVDGVERISYLGETYIVGEKDSFYDRSQDIKYYESKFLSNFIPASILNELSSYSIPN